MQQISTTTETQIGSDISWETILEEATLEAWHFLAPEKRKKIEKAVASKFQLSVSSFRHVKAEFVENYVPHTATLEEKRAAVADLFCNRHLISAHIDSEELSYWSEEFFGVTEVLDSEGAQRLSNYLTFDHLAALADCKLNGDLYIIEEEGPKGQDREYFWDRECSYGFAKNSIIHVFHIED